MLLWVSGGPYVYESDSVPMIFHHRFPLWLGMKNSLNLVTDLCTRHFETMSTFCKFLSGQKGGGTWVSLSLNPNSDEELVSILVRECLWVSGVYFVVGRDNCAAPRLFAASRFTAFTLISQSKGTDLILSVWCVQSGSCTVFQICFQ